MRWRVGIHRALRALLILVVTLVVLCVGIAVLLSLSPVRQRILQKALQAAQRQLPGTLTVERARWPSFGTLSLEGLRWVDEGDTLVAADRVGFSTRIRPLLSRDAHVEQVVLEHARADIGALQRAFPSSERSGPEPPAETSKELPFFRGGAIAGLPSVAVDEIDVGVDWLELPSGDRIVQGRIQASADLLDGHVPRLRLHDVGAASPRQGWWLDSFDVATGDAGRRAEGHLRARVGEAGREWPVRLELVLERLPEAETSHTSEPPRRVRLTVATEDGGRGEPELTLGVEAALEGLQPRVLDYDLHLTTPSTAELGKIPALAPHLQGVPDLAGISLQIEGAAHLDTIPSAQATLRVDPNTWLEGVFASVRYAGDTTTLDSLEVRLPDAALSAHGTMRADSLTAAAAVHVSGSRWMRSFVPQATPPESLRARLVVAARGARAAPALRARLEASGQVGGFHLQALDVQAEAPALRLEPVSVGLMARTQDIEVAFDGRVQLGDTLTARLSPLRVQSAASPPRTPTPNREPASIAFVPATGAIDVRRLQVRGEAGDVRLDAALDAQKKGSFDLNWTWREVPLLLLSRLDLSEEQVDALRRAWPRPDTFGLTVGGDFDLAGEVPRAHTQGRLLLPGPATLAPLLPAGAQVEDLGPVQASFGVELGPRVTLHFDAGDTDWIETARVDGWLEGSHVSLDSLRLAVEGIALQAAGDVADSLLDVSTSLEITDSTFLDRFAPSAQLDLNLAATAEVRGTKRVPEVQANLAGRVSTPTVDVPAVKARLSMSSSGLQATVEAPKGASVSSVGLTELMATYRTEPGSAAEVFPGRVGLRVAGRGLSVAQSLQLDRGEGWTAQIDTLDLVLLGKDLHARAPFELRFGTPHGASLEGLDLAGTLGTISGRGVFGPDSLVAVADLGLTLPGAPAALAVPPGIWPHALDLHVRADERQGVQARGTLGGLLLDGRETLSLAFDVDASLDRTQAHLTVLDGERQAAVGEASLPLSLHLAPMSAELRREDLSASLTFDALPIPYVASRKEALTPPLLDGRLSLTGSVTQPGLAGDVTVRFPQWPGLGQEQLRVTTGLDARTSVDSSRPGAAAASQGTAPQGTTAQKALAPGGPGFSVQATLGNDIRTMLRATASVPLHWDIDSLTVGVDSMRALALEIESQDLTLDSFNELLPPDMKLAGNLQLALSAQGKPGLLDLQGRVQAKDARASMADGSHVTLNADTRLTGTSRRPELKGTIVVQNGLIRIPEASKELLPTEGEATLWTLEGMEPESETAEPDTSMTTALEHRLEAQTEVRVEIPGGLWIRGRKLEIELAGDLKLVQTGAAPTVTGDLEAVRGSITFMGRNIGIQRGRVHFYGDDELDPSLDLLLSTKINSTTIEVQITGTVSEPKLELRSDPEMEQADIMSVLLFGKPSGELDQSQMDLLGQRAGDVLAVYAAAELTDRLSGQLGVDMISVRSGGGTGGDAASLVVGKYISDRVLLKYEQALQSGEAFFLIVEYSLHRDFKIDTRFGSQDKSAIELNWSKEY